MESVRLLRAEKHRAARRQKAVDAKQSKAPGLPEIRHISLAAVPAFQVEFENCMAFPSPQPSYTPGSE
jgi:hypothetical protein